MAGARARGGGRGRTLRRLAAAVVGSLALFAAWQALTWPDVAALATEEPGTTAFIEAWRARQRAAGQPDVPQFRFVPYGRIADDLKRAVLVGEDIGFFDHRGFEVEELKKALAEAREERELPRGASTITQQLAKNLWLSPVKTPWRKLEEAVLSWRLERALSKRRILELYLNVVQFGPGTYGAAAASTHYFGVPPSQLTADQAAQLAASLPRPSTWHPGASGSGYARHVERIRGRMERATWLEKLL
jgi:monofunctional biosynthetic peptidoglycan transglycosylase